MIQLHTMKLYHGSPKSDIALLDPRQVDVPEHLTIPDHEKLLGIYMTDSFPLALAMGLHVPGIMRINHEEKIISFENMDLFDPQASITIYSFKKNTLPLEKIIDCNDGWQYILQDMKLPISEANKETFEAGEILKYFEIV